MDFQKVILVTRKTQLEELIERHGTKDQAAFLLKQRGQSIDDFANAHDIYQKSLSELKAAIPSSIRLQSIDRSFLPNFLFGPNDLVLTLGQDGLVVNTAKYLNEQPIVAFNPDPSRIDGILIPFTMPQAKQVMEQTLSDALPRRAVTMARAQLDDGQKLDAVNDLFIGIQGHASARYQLGFNKQHEEQSSSGIIVSTGAGSTGWYSSIMVGAYGMAQGKTKGQASRSMFAIDSKELRFSVREPFISRTSQASLIHGIVVGKQKLEIVSRMPQKGIIFSDGMESDFLRFDSGMKATITIAPRQVQLFWKEDKAK
jgi:NAD kinase